MLLKEIKQNTIIKLQNTGIDSNEAAIETEILLNFVFEVTKKDLILDPEIELPEEKLKIFNSLIERRVKEKIPVQYLTNKAFFMGEEFYVDENVLIPRPETEILVEEVLHHCGNDKIKILDIGTGSGCIVCMLAKNLPNTKIFACDISEKALKVAEFNAEKLGVKDKITFINSDLFENIDINERFDVIVSNPPYIPILEKQNLQPEVVLHEPHQALFTEDKKGVAFYEKLALQATGRLNEGGYLAVEIGIFQSKYVVKILENAGFKEIKIIKDYSQINRVVIAKY
jgi:release factor glutamine methyltransferase